VQRWINTVSCGVAIKGFEPAIAISNIANRFMDLCVVERKEETLQTSHVCHIDAQADAFIRRAIRYMMYMRNDRIAAPQRCIAYLRSAKFAKIFDRSEGTPDLRYKFRSMIFEAMVRSAFGKYIELRPLGHTRAVDFDQICCVLKELRDEYNHFSRRPIDDVINDMFHLYKIITRRIVVAVRHGYYEAPRSKLKITVILNDFLAALMQTPHRDTIMLTSIKMERYFLEHGHHNWSARISISIHVDASKLGRGTISAMSPDTLLEIVNLLDEPLAGAIGVAAWINAIISDNDNIGKAFISLIRGEDDGAMTELVRRAIASGRVRDYGFLFINMAHILRHVDDAHGSEIIVAALEYIALNDCRRASMVMFGVECKIDRLDSVSVGNRSLMSIILEYIINRQGADQRGAERNIAVFGYCDIRNKITNIVDSNASPTHTDIIATKVFAPENYSDWSTRIPLNWRSFWAYRAIWPTVMKEGDRSTKAWLMIYEAYSRACQTLSRWFQQT
jgi:hypothetical protein